MSKKVNEEMEMSVMAEAANVDDWTEEASKAVSVVVSEDKTARKNDIVNSMNDTSNVMYQSFQAETKADRIKLFNASSGDGETVKSNLNKRIDIADVIVIPVEVKNEDGTSDIVPRSTIITQDGRYISATSWGVFNSLQKLAKIFDGLHFEKDDYITVMPVEVKTKNGFTINLRVV